MNPALRHQLAHLDRSLMALLNERARLLQEVALDDPGRNAALDDLQRRNPGPFPADGLEQVFGAVDAGCRLARVIS